MSKSAVDSEGFKVVSNRFSRKSNTKIPQKHSKIAESDNQIDVIATKQKITSAIEELQGSEYLERAIKAVSNIVDNRPLVEFLCFGLGHFSECQISRYQLALFLCLKSTFDPKTSLVHDPIFFKGECSLLKEFSLQVIEENNEGRYPLSTKGLTFVFLPHCPKQLTNNFLWSNWNSNIVNCILMCNSFKSLCENQPQRITSQDVPYIFKINPFIIEIELENNFRFTDIFNDTSLHIVSQDKITGVPSNFWDKPKQPEYQDTEEFITSQMIEKLKL